MKKLKTGGRTKGTPNKMTLELREKINLFLTNQWATMENEFESLYAKEKLQFYEKMLAYALPKLQSTTVEEVGEREEKKPFDLSDVFRFTSDRCKDCPHDCKNDLGGV